MSSKLQRTPWGGGKKKREENLTNDTPPKRGFGPPPRTVCFPTPSGVSALFFLYRNPRQSRPEALLVQKFPGDGVLWYVFLPPYVLHPPISWPNPNLPEFPQSRLSRSNDGHPQREGTNLGVLVPIWLVLCRCEATNLGVFDLCHFALLNQGCANSGGFGAYW